MALFGGKQRDRRVVIAGGGTGGHLFPGVAVAEAIGRIAPEIDVAFVGTERGIEARVIPELGYDLELIDVPMLKGGGTIGWLKGLSRLPLSGVQSMGVFKRLNPSVVISVGGYAAGPFTMLASVRGVPTALMEQNSVPGMTNRLLGKTVDRGFLTFEESRAHFPSLDCEVLGNPVRQSLLELAEDFTYEPPVERDEFRVLIIGGSGGAASFNRRLPADLCALEDLAEHVVVRHQCGKGRSSEVDGGYDAFGGQAEVVEFIDDMAAAYEWCDLLICRAGASTIAEVLVLGIPALYVPFPHAADDHQTTNAHAIAEAGAGIAISDADIGQRRATRLISGLIHNPVSLANVSKQARQLGRPRAAEMVARRCIEMMG